MPDEGLFVFECLYLFQILTDRFNSFGVQFNAIHSTVVEHGYFAGNTAFGLCACVEFQYEFLQLFLGIFGQLVEAPVTCVLGRKRIFGDPTAAGILVKIFGGRHGSVEVGQINTRNTGRFFIYTATHAKSCNN